MSDRPRQISAARYKRLSEAERAARFVQSIPVAFRAPVGVELPPELQAASAEVSEAVAIRCGAGSCRFEAGFIVGQSTVLGGGKLTVAHQLGFLPPRSYVQTAPGEFDLSERAKNRIAVGRSPHHARHRTKTRDVLAATESASWNQVPPHVIGELGTLLVRCGHCRENRWIRVDPAEAIAHLDGKPPQR